MLSFRGDDLDLECFSVVKTKEQPYQQGVFFVAVVATYVKLMHSEIRLSHWREAQQLAIKRRPNLKLTHRKPSKTNLTIAVNARQAASFAAAAAVSQSSANS